MDRKCQEILWKIRLNLRLKKRRDITDPRARPPPEKFEFGKSQITLNMFKTIDFENLRDEQTRSQH